MFRALGHPARLWIIELLGHRKCSVSELAQETGLPADTMSKHLRALAAVNIVCNGAVGAESGPPRLSRPALRRAHRG
jgi:ArsR family transcriptional regulator